MRRFLSLAALALAALTTAAVPLPQEAPEAVVVRVSGDVKVEPAGGNPATAAVGTRLAAGDKLVPAQGARAVIVHRSGVKEEVVSPITVETAATGDGGGMVTRTVRVLAQAATSNARTQPNRQGMIRPIPGEPVAVSPRNDIAVLGDHPSFRWTPVDGADDYTLQLRTEGERPVRYPVEGATSWTLPDDAPGLEPGKEYWWTVASVGTGRTRAGREQRFKLLDADRAREVDANLDAIRGLGLDPWSDGALLTATVFVDFGLYYDAARVIDTVEKSGPVTSDVYLLKGEVLDALGDLDAARQAFDRADGRTP